MPNINFTGWILEDSEGVLLRVIASTGPARCDACGSAARYFIVVSDGGVSPSCQACLEVSYDDPQSPDRWFAPVRKGTVPFVYSDGAQDVVVHIP